MNIPEKLKARFCRAHGIPLDLFFEVVKNNATASAEWYAFKSGYAVLKRENDDLRRCVIHPTAMRGIKGAISYLEKGTFGNDTRQGVIDSLKETHELFILAQQEYGGEQ